MLGAYAARPRNREGKGRGNIWKRELPRGGAALSHELPLNKIFHRVPLKSRPWPVSLHRLTTPMCPDPTDSPRKRICSHSRPFLLEDSKPPSNVPSSQAAYSPSPPDSSLLHDPLYPYALLPMRSHSSPSHSRVSRAPLPPEGSDAPVNVCPCPSAFPECHRLYPAQSGSGKPRPRRSCRTT